MLVRRIWELMLTGIYTPREIWLKACREWGLVTRQRKSKGGNPLALSAIYKILGNPFYAGVLHWHGKEFVGKHAPMVTLEQFDRVQDVLGGRNRRRPQHHDFPFTGMIRCGACGFGVTAEHKVNRHGSHYEYYHCTRNRRYTLCREPAISALEVDRQVTSFLGEITLPESIHQWALSHLQEASGQETETRETYQRSLLQGKEAAVRQLENLARLRIRDLLTDEEYLRQRQELERTRLQAEQALQQVSAQPNWIEPAELLISFSKSAVTRFQAGDIATKRLILEVVGSNPSLKDKRLSISAKKPFFRRSDLEKLPLLSG